MGMSMCNGHEQVHVHARDLRRLVRFPHAARRLDGCRLHMRMRMRMHMHMHMHMFLLRLSRQSTHQASFCDVISGRVPTSCHQASFSIAISADLLLLPRRRLLRARQPELGSPHLRRRPLRRLEGSRLQW